MNGIRGGDSSTCLVARKHEYQNALRAFQQSTDAMKSDAREEEAKRIVENAK
jgi:hypothetical protein